MKVYTMSFSPTGGTKKILDILAGEFGTPKEMDFSLPGKDYGLYRFEPGDVCLVGAPCFGGRIPKAAIENFTKVRAKGAAAVVVVSYGNRAYEDALLELRKAMEGRGFQVVAAVAAVAEHSITRQYGRGRPDDRDCQDLRFMAKDIRKILLKPDSWSDFYVPGRFPYKEYHTIPMVPETGGSCKGCGKCVDFCPAAAIPRDTPRKTDRGRCISCMRCVQVCPEHARKVNKLMLFGASMKLRKACSGRKENELYLSSSQWVGFPPV